MQARRHPIAGAAALLLHAILLILILKPPAKEAILPLPVPIRVLPPLTTISAKRNQASLSTLVFKMPSLAPAQIDTPRFSVQPEANRIVVAALPHAAQTPIIKAGGTAQSPAPGTAPQGKGANPGPTPGIPVDSSAIDRYLAMLRDLIQQALIYPPEARRFGLSGTVMVKFGIEANGQLQDGSIQIVGSDPDNPLARGARHTIQAIASFPPPPTGRVLLIIPVSFTYQRG